MKTKLLLKICLLLITSQVFSSDDLSGKKLYCKSKNEDILATYNFTNRYRHEKFVYHTMVRFDYIDAWDYGRHYYKHTGNYFSYQSRANSLRGKLQNRFIQFGFDYEYYIYEAVDIVDYDGSIIINAQPKTKRLERDVVEGGTVLTEYLDRETLKIYSSMNQYAKKDWNFSCNLFDGSKKDLFIKAEKEHFEIHKMQKKQLWEWREKQKEQQVKKNKI